MVFKRWCFHPSGRSRLTSSCKVEHAMGLQKMVFPSLWALEAHVVLQIRACHWSSKNGVSIFLQAATITYVQASPALTSAKKGIRRRFALHPNLLHINTQSKRDATAMKSLRYQHRRRRFRPRAGGDVRRAVNQAGMKPTLLTTSEYMNKVTTKTIRLQTMFPTCCASLPS